MVTARAKQLRRLDMTVDPTTSSSSAQRGLQESLEKDYLLMEPMIMLPHSDIRGSRVEINELIRFG